MSKENELPFPSMNSYRLKQLFPDIEYCEIERVLKCADGDLDKSYALVMNQRKDSSPKSYTSDSILNSDKGSFLNSPTSISDQSYNASQNSNGVKKADDNITGPGAPRIIKSFVKEASAESSPKLQVRSSNHNSLKEFFPEANDLIISSALADAGDDLGLAEQIMVKLIRRPSSSESKNFNHNFLKDFFPDETDEVISSALNDAGGDMGRAQNILINLSQRSSPGSQLEKPIHNLLKECSPGKSDEKIDNAVRDFNGDLSQTSNFLVSGKGKQESNNASNTINTDFDKEDTLNEDKVSKKMDRNIMSEEDIVSITNPPSTGISEHFLKEFFPQTEMATISKALEMAKQDVNEATNLIITWNEEEEVKAENAKIDARALDPDSPEYKVNSLSEVFNHIDNMVIAKVLEESDYDMLRASESLLNYDLIEKIERDLRIQVDNFNKTKLDQINTKKDAWGSANDKISEIVKLLSIDKNIVKTYYHKNNGNSILTIVDVIFNLRREIEEKEKEEKKKALKLQNEEWKSLQSKSIPKDGKLPLQYHEPTNSSATKVLLPKGGRVQNGLNSTQPKFNTVKSRLKKNKPNDLKDERHYHYEPNSPEAQELATMVYEDPTLVEISWEFYQKCMIFFKGEVSKVISLALFIVENDGATITYRNKFDQMKAGLGKPKAEDSQPFSWASISSRSSSSSRELERKADDFAEVMKKTKARRSSEDDRQSMLQKRELNKCRHTNELDLHGFQVQNARETVEIALKDWWSDELQAREQHGNSGRGYKAREVDPLKIITGRGIHSEGGFSKVRASVKKWLNNSEYHSHEETAGFVVTGLKKP